MYKGYGIIKKTKHRVSLGYQKQPEGIENVNRVQETCRLADLQTCMYSGNYFELCALGQVSKMLGGYQKYQEGIKNV